MSVCENCEKSRAVFVCDCCPQHQQLYCNTCAEAHKTLKQFRSHTLKPYDKLPQDKTQKEGRFTHWMALYSIVVNIVLSKEWVLTAIILIGSVMMRALFGRKLVMLTVALLLTGYWIMKRRRESAGHIKSSPHNIRESQKPQIIEIGSEQGNEFWHEKQGKNASFRKRGRPYVPRGESFLFYIVYNTPISITVSQE
jgi:hypothetical protein